MQILAVIFIFFLAAVGVCGVLYLTSSFWDATRQSPESNEVPEQQSTEKRDLLKNRNHPEVLPSEIFDKEGQLLISDCFSIYNFNRDGSFELGPTGESGLQVTGTWKALNTDRDSFEIVGQWGWINGLSAPNDFRVMQLRIVSLYDFKIDTSISGRTAYPCRLSLDKPVKISIADLAQRLAEKIPPPNPALYDNVKESKNWRNPFFTVSKDGISLRGEQVAHSYSEYNSYMSIFSLPPAAWPYGRIAAVSEGKIRPGNDDAAIQKNRDTLLKTLKDLGIEVYIQIPESTAPRTLSGSDPL